MAIQWDAWVHRGFIALVIPVLFYTIPKRNRHKLWTHPYIGLLVWLSFGCIVLVHIPDYCNTGLDLSNIECILEVQESMWYIVDIMPQLTMMWTVFYFDLIHLHKSFAAHVSAFLGTVHGVFTFAIWLSVTESMLRFMLYSLGFFLCAVFLCVGLCAMYFRKDGDEYQQPILAEWGADNHVVADIALKPGEEEEGVSREAGLRHYADDIVTAVPNGSESGDITPTTENSSMIEMHSVALNAPETTTPEAKMHDTDEEDASGIERRGRRKGSREVAVVKEPSQTAAVVPRSPSPRSELTLLLVAANIMILIFIIIHLIERHSFAVEDTIHDSSFLVHAMHYFQHLLCNVAFLLASSQFARNHS